MQEAVVNMIKSKIAHGKFGEVYFVYGLDVYHRLYAVAHP